MRMRKKPNLIPRMQRCEAVLVKNPQDYKGKWRELMPQCRQLMVELGCGKGKFTLETANENPDNLYVALERVPDAMVMAMEKAVAMGLKNIYFISADAAQLDDIFAPGEIDLIYINFCDPWPSRKHAGRRLTSPDFLKCYQRVLKIGGAIHFKTDNAPLFEYTLKQLSTCKYSVSDNTWNLHKDGIKGILTGYEEKFVALGVPICRCVAVLQSD